MARRPRGICPACRNTMSLTWSGDVRVLRKHAAGGKGSEEACVGSGRPAVGEVTEISLGRPARTSSGAPTLNRSSAA